MTDKLDKLNTYARSNIDSLWKRLESLTTGHGEIFNEVYWFVMAKLKLESDLTPREIDDLSTIAAYRAIHGPNLSAISRAMGKNSSGSRKTIANKIDQLRRILC